MTSTTGEPMPVQGGKTHSPDSSVNREAAERLMRFNMSPEMGAFMKNMEA